MLYVCVCVFNVCLDFRWTFFFYIHIFLFLAHPPLTQHSDFHPRDDVFLGGIRRTTAIAILSRFKRFCPFTNSAAFASTADHRCELYRSGRMFLRMCFFVVTRPRDATLFAPRDTSQGRGLEAAEQVHFLFTICCCVFLYLHCISTFSFDNKITLVGRTRKASGPFVFFAAAAAASCCHNYTRGKARNRHSIHDRQLGCMVAALAVKPWPRLAQRDHLSCKGVVKNSPCAGVCDDTTNRGVRLDYFWLINAPFQSAIFAYLCFTFKISGRTICNSHCSHKTNRCREKNTRTQHNTRLH